MASQGPTRDLGRKKSLIRPERNRIDRAHPNYHYRQHAHNMEVFPSTTGNDPMMEDYAEAQTLASEITTLRDLSTEPPDAEEVPRDNVRAQTSQNGGRTQSRLISKQHKAGTEDYKRRQNELDTIKPPSIWNVYCHVITFWCPDVILTCFGKPAKAQRRAWREKMGLLSIIILICAFVGFLTFGFTQAVCGTQGLRLQINHVDSGYMIFHGQAYNLVYSAHPAALGIPLDSNVLYDLPHKYGGQDGSFMFQNVNGACKDLITLAQGSDVHTDGNGDLAWYFP